MSPIEERSNDRSHPERHPVQVAGEFPQAGQRQAVSPGRRRPRRRRAGSLCRQAQDPQHLPKRRYADLRHLGTQVQRPGQRPWQTPRLHFRRPARAEAFLWCRRAGERGQPVDHARCRILRDYGVALASGPLAGVAARAVIVLDEQEDCAQRTGQRDRQRAELRGGHRLAWLKCTSWRRAPELAIFGDGKPAVQAKPSVVVN